MYRSLCLRNDLNCVEWDVKPCSTINHTGAQEQDPHALLLIRHSVPSARLQLPSRLFVTLAHSNSFQPAVKFLVQKLSDGFPYSVDVIICG